jgi:hypothetical protein
MRQHEFSRTHSANQVCAQFREHHRSAHARLVIDQSHPFFFDHPLDHVPGLLLIEAMNQLAEREAYRASANAGHGPLHTISAEVTFNKFCVFGGKAWIMAEAQDADGRRIRTRVEQEGVINCKGVFEYEPYEMPPFGSQDREKQADFHEAAEQLSLTPCPKELVNKFDEANVMIDTPVRIGSTLNANVLPPHPRNVLVDNRYGLLPAVYLLEAYMQTQRYLNKVFMRQNETIRMRDTLCGVSIRLLRPVQREEGVRIEHTIAENGVPKTGLRLQQGALYVARECIGDCNIKTVTVI